MGRGVELSLDGHWSSAMMGGSSACGGSDAPHDLHRTRASDRSRVLAAQAPRQRSLPGHPTYTGPKLGERHCYLAGILRFEDADAVVVEPSNLQPAISADKTLDLGQIDEWESGAGHHRLSGEWGELEVSGGELSVGVDFPGDYLTEFLASLPSYGSPALTIADGESGMGEGLVLRVHTGRGSWIANVQRGWSNSPDQVLRTPQRDRFVALEGGGPSVSPRQPRHLVTPLACFHSVGSGTHSGQI